VARQRGRPLPRLVQTFRPGRESKLGRFGAAPCEAAALILSAQHFLLGEDHMNLRICAIAGLALACSAAQATGVINTDSKAYKVKVHS